MHEISSHCYFIVLDKLSRFGNWLFIFSVWRGRHSGHLGRRGSRPQHARHPRRLPPALRGPDVRPELRSWERFSIGNDRLVPGSVSRLSDLLHFGQLFKACSNNYLAQIAHILDNFCKGVKIFQFSSEIIFGQHFLTIGDFLRVTLGHFRVTLVEGKVLVPSSNSFGQMSPCIGTLSTCYLGTSSILI